MPPMAEASNSASGSPPSTAHPALLHAPPTATFPASWSRRTPRSSTVNRASILRLATRRALVSSLLFNELAPFDRLHGRGQITQPAPDILSRLRVPEGICGTVLLTG